MSVSMHLADPVSGCVDCAGSNVKVILTAETLRLRLRLALQESCRDLRSSLQRLALASLNIVALHSPAPYLPSADSSDQSAEVGKGITKEYECI